VPGHEGAAIARYIDAEVAAGRRTYGDFLILTRRKKTLTAYAEALEARRIPIEVSGAGAFAESVEVREIALLLIALTDPQDAVSLVGVLRGPLFGLSDRDLYAWRQSGGWFDLHGRSAAPDQVPPAPVGAALDSLRRWFTWTRMLPAGAALERILEDSGYLALAATTPDGVEAGDLLHAVDRVRAAVEGGFTLARAAEALAAYCGLDEDPDDSTEVESLPLGPGRSNVVRVMNLHKAKGLEAPVVFLADPRGGFEPRVDVRILRDGASAIGYFPIATPVGAWGRRLLAEPQGWNALEADERAYLDAEGDRLLYVAATRARDLLVIGRYVGKATGTKAAWEPFEEPLRRFDAPELSVPAHVPPPVPEVVDVSTEAAAAAGAAAARAHDRVRQPSWTAASVTAEVKRLPRMMGVPADAGEADDPTRVITTETPSHRADAGAAWGTLVHGLLEHAMRHPSATRDDLRRLAMWLTLEEPDLRVVVDRALETVDAVATAGFWTAARAAVEVHEEAPFAAREQAADGLPQVIAGVIDLVYRDADGWQVVDYKTDRDGETADLAARYRGQIAAYERAWGRVARAKVASAVVSARPSDPSG
jgi:ATP-dependent helicase/nuclease subunit A